MENGIIIKIVSSEETMIVTVSEMLKQASRSFDSELYSSFDAFLSSLSKETEGIAVIDCSSGHFDWQEVLLRVKNYDESLYTIIIISENERDNNHQ